LKRITAGLAGDEGGGRAGPALVVAVGAGLAGRRALPNQLARLAEQSTGRGVRLEHFEDLATYGTMSLKH